MEGSYYYWSESDLEVGLEIEVASGETMDHDARMAFAVTGVDNIRKEELNNVIPIIQNSYPLPLSICHGPGPSIVIITKSDTSNASNDFKTTTQAPSYEDDKVDPNIKLVLASLTFKPVPLPDSKMNSPRPAKNLKRKLVPKKTEEGVSLATNLQQATPEPLESNETRTIQASETQQGKVDEQVNEMSHICEQCGKSFKTLPGLNIHVACAHKRGTGEHVCNYCGKCYQRASYLREHKKIHTGEIPYKCDVCGKEFLQRSNIYKHKKVHKAKISKNTDLDNRQNRAAISTSKPEDSEQSVSQGTVKGNMLTAEKTSSDKMLTLDAREVKVVPNRKSPKAKARTKSAMKKPVKNITQKEKKVKVKPEQEKIKEHSCGEIKQLPNDFPYGTLKDSELEFASIPTPLLTMTDTNDNKMMRTVNPPLVQEKNMVKVICELDPSIDWSCNAQQNLVTNLMAILNSFYQL